MSGLNINSPEIQALFAKADLNKDGNIDANEQKALNAKELSIFNQYNTTNAAGNNNNVTNGNQSPIINQGGKSAAGAVTYGDGAGVNQATGDNAKIITLYKESKVPENIAKMFMDAGYTTQEDVNYVTGMVVNKQFNDLTPEQQQAQIEKITNSTNAFKEMGIDLNTAKIMVKGGVKEEADIKNARNLVGSTEFKALSSNEQTILLQNVKHPLSITSLIGHGHGEFDHFEIDTKGHLMMTSSKHEYQLNLDPKDTSTMARIRTTYGQGKNEAKFVISGAETGKMTIKPDPEGAYDNPNLVRTVSFKGCGNSGNGTRFEVENQTQRKHIYEIHPTYIVNNRRYISYNALAIRTCANDVVRSYSDDKHKQGLRWDYPVTAKGTTFYVTESTDKIKVPNGYAYITKLFSSGLGTPEKFINQASQWVKTQTYGNNRT